MDFEMSINCTKNSLVPGSDEMKQIQSCAAENEIVVGLGYSERKGNSTYMGQCTIDNDGKVLMMRQKLKPFHIERTIFGDGDGASLDNVVSTSAGRVGQLSCGVSPAPFPRRIQEKPDSDQGTLQPPSQLQYLLPSEEIHITAWPPVAPHPGGPAPYSMSDDAVSKISQVYSMQRSASSCTPPP
jgi:hypothetical protein